MGGGDLLFRFASSIQSCCGEGGALQADVAVCREPAGRCRCVWGALAVFWPGSQRLGALSTGVPRLFPPRPPDTVILGFLTIIKNCQASSKLEAVNSTWLSRCQRHVRPIFEMKWSPRAFSRVSSGDSDILSSCDMNDEHA